MDRLLPTLLLIALLIGLSGSRTASNANQAGVFQLTETEEGPCEVFGKIKFVDHFADYKVKIVEHHEDLRVEYVEHFADEPGKWEVVEHHEDYKIEVVEHHEDFSVKMVEHFPGCN